MRRIVLLVVAGWVSAVALAACPPCINTNSSACSRWGSGQAFFKWASDPEAGSDITLTATVGACGGASGGESGKAYIIYVNDTHSDICKGQSSPCDDGFGYKESIAIIKVSGNKMAFKNTLGGLSFTGDKVYEYKDGEFFSSVAVTETGCQYKLPMEDPGFGRIKLEAGVMNLDPGAKGGKFNISVKFYAILGKTGENDRYVLLASAEGSINVKVNQSRNSNPVSFQPDLRDGSSMAGSKSFVNYYSVDDGDTDWRLAYRGGDTSGCDQSEFWAGKWSCDEGEVILIPKWEEFSRVKYPGWGSGVNGNPPFIGQGGWKNTPPDTGFAMLAMNSTDWLWRYLLMSSGYIQNTQYMMHYEMGDLGRMYYRGEEYSGGLRVRQIEYCPKGTTFGQGQILWTFCYDSSGYIQYIHNAIEDPNNPSDPDSPDGATAYYNYDYTQGDGNDPIVTYYTRPDIQTPWAQQPNRQWELEFDNEGRATKFQGGCSSGCGGTGTFEHVEYLPGHDDLITKQYNAANSVTPILENQYEEITYGKYEPAGGIPIRNGGFGSPDVAANSYQIVSSLSGWELTPGDSVKICDPNTGSDCQYLEFSDTTEQTLTHFVSAVSFESQYTLQAKFRAHGQINKHGSVELWIVKDSQSEKVATIDVNDLDLQGSTWVTESVNWDNRGDTRFAGILLQDLWFFEIVVDGIKVDIDDITLSRAIWVGNKTKPIIKEQKKADSQSTLVTTLKREFDKANSQIIERQFVSANQCRVIQYDYEDETFTNLLSKTEWEIPFSPTVSPSGTSYVTIYSNDANNVINLPGGKSADIKLYDPNSGKLMFSCRRDLENDVNSVREVNTYIDIDNADLTADWRIKTHTNAAGGVTEYEYDSTTKLLKKKTDPQTAAGRLVTEYFYDGARRLILEQKTKQGEPANILHRTANLYNPVTGYLDKTEERGGSDYAETYYTYNSLGQMTRQMNPDRVVTGKSYGLGGQLISEFTLAPQSDPNDPDDELFLISQTLYTYNNDGLIEKIGKYKADGTFLYKSSIPAPADPNYWVVTKYEYYPDGRQWKVIEDFGGANLTTEYFYNLQGEVEKVIYPTGKWIKTTRDGRGLVILEEVGHSTSTVVMETAYAYDADGNLKEQHNPDGKSQYYTYNNFGQLKRAYQQDPNNSPYTEKFYDTAGNVNRELSVDSDGTLLRDIRRQYDKAGNLELERICAEPNQIDNADDIMTWYVYDILGNLKKTIQEGLDCCDPNDIPNTSDVITQYFYDGLARRQHTLSPVGVLSSVFYTPGGLPETIVGPNDPADPNGDCVTLNYFDAAGRLEKSVDPEGHYTINTYNSLNQLIKQTVFDCNETPSDTDNDFAVRQTRTQYDNLGNITRQVVMKNPISQNSPVVGVDLITDYVYNSKGQLYQTKTYYGDNTTAAVTTFDYDSIGRKIGTIDPEGNEDHIVYSEVTPALVEKTERLENNPGGNDYTITTFFEYDDYGRLWKRFLDKDGDGNKEETDTITEYLYDGLGRLTNEIAPDEVVTFTDYDGFGNVWQKIEDYDPENEDAFNKTTEYVYNRLNRLYKIKVYDPNDTTTQVSIQTTTYEYDKAGAVIKITYPDNKSLEYIYNIQNKLDTEIQRNGRWIAYWYDQNRNLIQVSDYDSGDPNCPTNEATFVETFTYDAAGNLKMAEKYKYVDDEPEAVSQSQFTYNGFGLKTSETATYFELQPVTTTWDYDGSGNLISQTHAGTILSYTHDGLGRIKTIDRNEERIVNYSYIGRATKAIEYPEPQVTQSYSYDELGRVDGVSSIDGQDITILDFVYDYDNVGNRQSEEYHHLDTPVWDKFYYDNLRRLKQVEYAQSSGFSLSTETTETHIGLDRLAYLASYVLRWLDDATIPVSEKENLAQRRKDAEKQNEYNITSVNSVAKLLTLAEFGSSESAESVKSVVPKTETIYDDDGTIAAQIMYDANDNITLFAIYLDDGGKVVITSYYDATGILTSNICTTYDADGNVISREEMPLPTETAEITESVIPAEAGIQISPSVSSVNSVADTSSQADLWLMEADLLYSDSGMMLMSSTPQSSEFAFEEFTYDNLGNRYQETDKYGTTYTYSHNTANQYSKRHGLVLGYFEYDEYFSHDDNGNLEIDQNSSVYTYDYRNRLISIGDGQTTAAEYVYDALGRRICKTSVDSVSFVATYFYYDTDNRVIAQYVQEQSQDVQPDRTFVYGNGITEVLAMFLYEKPYSQDDVELLFGFFDCWLTSTGGSGYNDDYEYIDDGKIDLKDWSVLVNRSWNLPEPATHETRFYYLTDALGSVRGLIGGKFNREEDREFYNYDVYGDSSDVSAAGNPFRFAGYRYDPETGLYHLWTRAYDPVTGRPLQMDRDYYDSMNLKEYCLSNPTNFVDPWGLWSKNGMLQEYNRRYGIEGQMLLGLMGYEGFSIEPRNYWFDDWAFEEENGVLGIASWGVGLSGWGIDDSDATAARQLHDALKSRYGKILGKFLKGCLKNLCGAGQIAGKQSWADDPAFQSFIGTYDQQQLAAALMGSAVQNYTEEEAKAFIASIVGGKCLDKALEALQDARQARRAAKAAKEGIYEFPDAKAGGKPYVGQSGDIPNRLKQHQDSGRLTPGVDPHTTPVQGGKTAREIAEHNRIQDITGGVPASKSGAVSNKRDPIGPKRRGLIQK